MLNHGLELVDGLRHSRGCELRAALRRVARGLLLGPDHDGPRGAARGACAADRTRAAEGRRVLRLGALCGVVVVAGPSDGVNLSIQGPRPTTVRWRRRLCVIKFADKKSRICASVSTTTPYELRGEEETTRGVKRTMWG